MAIAARVWVSIAATVLRESSYSKKCSAANTAATSVSRRK